MRYFFNNSMIMVWVLGFSCFAALASEKSSLEEIHAAQIKAANVFKFDDVVELLLKEAGVLSQQDIQEDELRELYPNGLPIVQLLNSTQQYALGLQLSAKFIILKAQFDATAPGAKDPSKLMQLAYVLKMIDTGKAEKPKKPPLSYKGRPKILDITFEITRRAYFFAFLGLGISALPKDWIVPVGVTYFALVFSGPIVEIGWRAGRRIKHAFASPPSTGAYILNIFAYHLVESGMEIKKVDTIMSGKSCQDILR